MLLAINTLYLIILIWLSFKYLKSQYVENKLKVQGEEMPVRYSGLEFLVILLISTGVMGFLPLLAVHLIFVEIMCVLILRSAPSKPVIALPIKLFFLFILWTIIGLTYTPSVLFGLRMILKYIYPPLIALVCSAVVDNIFVFLRTGFWSRILSAISFVSYYIPMNGIIFMGVFWNRAALATNYIIWTIYSFALYSFGIDKKSNLRWGILFIIPCLVWAFRTDIFGTSVALAAFFFIKYRFKSLPLIIGMAVLAVCALFFIPSIKAKMYFKPEEVTISDFISGNVDEKNINTSGRNEMWNKVTPFYEDHPMVGSGTGRVQKYFYTEIMGFGRGGQLHNDLLLIKCDNGMIGLVLFLASYLAILLHCVKIYHKSASNATKLCTITAGASLFGLMVTLYSDNTVSYSLATLGIPWAFYGMALGIYRKEQETI